MHVLVKVQVFKEMVFNKKKVPSFWRVFAKNWVMSHFLHFKKYFPMFMKICLHETYLT